MTQPADTLPTVRAVWAPRYTLVALSFLAVFICYMDRVNISVAIIPMAAEFGWQKSTQGYVLSSFFIGYLATQILGGRLSDRFGGKVVLGAAVLFWSAFTMLTPVAALLGFSALLTARIGMGAGEGVAFPAIYSLFGRALPDLERSRAIATVLSAMPLGNVFAVSTTPLIVIAWGWPAAFYTFGALGVIWWWFWHTRVDGDLRSPSTGAEPIAPIEPIAWRALLRCMPVWAIVVCHFANNWGWYLLLAWLPTYINEALGVKYANVGFVAMLPYLSAFLFSNVAGFVADRLIARGRDVTRVRKTVQTISFGGAAATLTALSFVHDATLAIALMSVGGIMVAFSWSGFSVNHLDIAPRHAGVLMGISNTAGTIPGVISVTVSGWILQATGSWALVFQVAAGVYVAGLLFYLVFGSSKRLFD